LRAVAPDLRTIENWIAESGEKQENAANPAQKPGQRVDDAHDAVLLCSFAVLALEGWRVKNEPGHHIVPIEAACALVRTSQGLCDRLLATSKLRNDKYTGVRRTPADAEAAVGAMDEFLRVAEPWIADRVKAMQKSKPAAK
jgi:hypothetical protein